jgi:hypothetical protein
MRTPLLLIAILAALCALPATALAGSVSNRIYSDCENSPTGSLTGTYTKAQLESALANLPSDISEYSGCYDAIHSALLSGGGGGTHGGNHGNLGNGGTPTPGGGGGAGSTGGGGAGPGGGAAAPGTPGSPTATTATVTPRPGVKAPVQLEGATVQPGAIPALGRNGHTLPTPLVAFLVLLGAGLLAGVTTTIGRRVLARRGA